MKVNVFFSVAQHQLEHNKFSEESGYETGKFLPDHDTDQKRFNFYQFLKGWKVTESGRGEKKKKSKRYPRYTYFFFSLLF